MKKTKERPILSSLNKKTAKEYFKKIHTSSTKEDIFEFIFDCIHGVIQMVEGVADFLRKNKWAKDKLEDALYEVIAYHSKKEWKKNGEKQIIYSISEGSNFIQQIRHDLEYILGLEKDSDFTPHLYEDFFHSLVKKEWNCWFGRVYAAHGEIMVEFDAKDDVENNVRIQRVEI